MSRKSARFAICVLSCVLWGLLTPGPASPAWVKEASLLLREYTDPQFARTGTFDSYVDEALTVTPYGFPYWGVASVGGVCKTFSDPVGGIFNVYNDGGEAAGWLAGYTTNYSLISQYDPYADIAFVIPYGKSWDDGSWGEDYQCPQKGGGTYERNGEMAIFVRMPDYQYIYEDTGPYFYGTFLHLADLLDCSDELGCQWYMMLIPLGP